MPQKNWVRKATGVDPDERYAAARHEAGHAVMAESLNPGSVEAMAIGQRGGITSVVPSNVQDFVTNSVSGGLAEPRGTTITHASGDRAARNQLIGQMASTPMQNLHRLITGRGASNDPMLEAPQMQAQGQARFSALMADPRARKSIENVTTGLAGSERLSGNEVRKMIAR